MKEQSDRNLLEDFGRDGREAAFDELAKRYQKMIYATAYRMCGERSEAQDVLQQSLIVLANRAGSLSKVKCLGAWLHRVAVLESKKAMSKSYRIRRREAKALELEQLETEGHSLTEELAPELDELLDSLDEKDRHVLTLHYLEGRTFTAVAELCGGSAQAWQKRSVRALGKLTKKLQAKGVVMPVATLAGVMLSTKSEAGVTSTVLAQMTKAAVTAPGVSPAAGLGSLLLSMKLGIGVSLVGGALLSYTWSSEQKRAPEMVDQREERMSAVRETRSKISGRYGVRTVSHAGFSVEVLASAVAEYDSEESMDASAESRLKALMFSVPEQHLEEVFQLLKSVRHERKFQDVAAAFFARWTELDPQLALERAGSAGELAHSARRGVIVTWLELDFKAATQVMARQKTPEDRSSLFEYLAYKAEVDAPKAAEVVDYVVEYWPEVDARTFPLVADYWSRMDPSAAGEWVASYHDEKVKNPLLWRMAGKVAKMHGFEGIKIADRIEDPKLRASARNNAIRWWAVTIGGHSLTKDRVKPNRDLSGGFPEDWTDENVFIFSRSLMVNYKQTTPDLLKLAATDSQRLQIHKGVLNGTCYSDPAAGVASAEALPDREMQNANSKKIMEGYIRTWYAKDAAAAEAWLSKQPAGLKSSVMWAELGRIQKK